MHNSKLLDIIKLLDRLERQSFQQYLNSDYFEYRTKQPEICDLFQHIQYHSSDFEHPALEKKATFKVLFPKTKYKSGKMDKIMSSLLGALTYFLGFHNRDLKQAIVPQQLALVNYLKRKKADAAAQHYFKKLNKTIDQLELNDRDYYFNKYLIEQEHFEQLRLVEKQMQGMDHLRTLQSLDIFYLISKLEHACFLLSENKFRKPLELKGLIDFLDNIKPQFEKNGSLEIPIINLYYSIYELLKSDQAEEVQFEKIQRIIDQELDSIPFGTLKALAALMRNYRIIQYHLSESLSSSYIFRLYKRHLEQGFLIYESGILASTYKNMVTLGLRAGEFDWVHQFIHEYKDKIEGMPPENEFYSYNLAQYHFSKKDYDQALALLMYSFDEIYLKIAAKILELKILFETKSQILPSRIDAFKLFMHRLSSSEIIPSKKKQTVDFINLLRQIANPTTQLDHKKLHRILDKVKNNDIINEKEWLLRALGTLIKN